MLVMSFVLYASFLFDSTVVVLFGLRNGSVYFFLGCPVCVFSLHVGLLLLLG